jgi:DNA gyrase subunit A
VVIEIKRGEEAQLVRNHLYKLAQIQESFGMILLAITGGQPREMGLLEFLRLFLEHRREVVLRRTRYDLRKAEEREHILLGYRIAQDHLDNVIKVIRSSSSRANARENLFAYFDNKSVNIITGSEKTETLKGVKLTGKKDGLCVDRIGLTNI